VRHKRRVPAREHCAFVRRADTIAQSLFKTLRRPARRKNRRGLPTSPNARRKTSRRFADAPSASGTAGQGRSFHRPRRQHEFERLRFDVAEPTSGASVKPPFGASMARQVRGRRFLLL
jgi:hypothetical protein